MKKIAYTFGALAILSTATLASGEHCVTRNVVANYANGSGVSTQCFSSESNYKAPKADKCDYKR